MAENQRTIKRFVESKAYISKEAWKVLVEKFKNKRFAIHILLASIEGLNPDTLKESDLDDIYLDLAKIKERIGHKGNDTIRLMKQAIKYIFEALIEFENDELWSITPFFHQAMIHKRKALAKVSISPLFIHHLANLKQFLTLRSRIIKANTRAIVFYGTLKSIHNSNVFKMPIDELQERCHQNYSTYSGFKNRFLVPIIEELAGYGITITFNEIKAKANGKVTALSFEIDEKLLPEEQLAQVHQTEVPRKFNSTAPMQVAPYKSSKSSQKLLDELKKPVILTPEQEAEIKKIQAELREKFGNKMGVKS